MPPVEGTTSPSSIWEGTQGLISFYFSEFSTATASNSNVERDHIDRFSTADAIAIPHMKMQLERNRREYRHAPILNPMTRELEEGRTVILGRDIDLTSKDFLAEAVVMACLNRYTTLDYHWYKRQQEVGWHDLWHIIHEMEAEINATNLNEVISKLWDRTEIAGVVYVTIRNTKSPLLHIADEQSVKKLERMRGSGSSSSKLLTIYTGNHWDRSALANVMKGIDPGVRRFLETFAIAYVTYPMAYPILHATISDIILRMWDFTKWRPLPDDVEWERGSGSPPCLCRMKRFQAKPGHGRWVKLEVDENGDVLDIPVNRVRKEWIEEGTVARVGKVLQRLKI
ncbi:hypothetical protein FRC17_008855 [Serendipita sp. 399]|nr:hypothetical protein FRC17_008855 [Serendipita sp. 399]